MSCNLLFFCDVHRLKHAGLGYKVAKVVAMVWYKGGIIIIALMDTCDHHLLVRESWQTECFQAYIFWMLHK